MDRILRERNANCVTDSIRKEASYTDGALDSAVFTIACFGDTKMNRVVPENSVSALDLSLSQFLVLKSIEACYQQTVGLNHDLRIR